MDKVSSRCDVLVIGAGPAGAAAAIVAARAGCDVRILDRAHFPRDKTCGDAVSNHGMAVLDELGAGDAVRAQPHALVRKGVAIFPDGATVARSYDVPGYIVTRLVLDDCLQRAAMQAGARMSQDTRVESLRKEGGAIVGALTATECISATVVIAADGYGSVAWPALGIEKPRGRRLGVSTTL